ncbi:MAG: hypothetical protein ACO4CT_09950 [Planctomycetota bacterium]
MILRPLALCCAVAVPATAQSISWLEPASPSTFHLRRVPAATPAAAPSTALADFELLPIEISQRTRQQSLRDDVSHRRESGNRTWIELPGHGRLFAFRRAIAGGGVSFGYLHIEADGDPRVVLEAAGFGAAGDANPFGDRIGIAPDGAHALVCTLDEQLPHLFVVRLDGLDFASTQAPSRGVMLGRNPADPLTLTVGSLVAWCGSERAEVFRIPLADGSVAEDVTPAGGPGVNDMKPEFIASADGRTAGFLFGPDEEQHVYIVGEVGTAVAVTPTPSKYDDPGYLPEIAGGPRMMLNDDATSLLYTDGALRDEGFVLDLRGVAATTHWTGDHNFTPYIGVIILPVATGPGFAAGIGDPGRFDLHRAEPGTTMTTNLTLTANPLSAPWTEGSLIPLDNAVAANGAVLSVLQPNDGRPATFERFDGAVGTVLAQRVDGDLGRGLALPGAGSAAFRAPSWLGDLMVDGEDGQPVFRAPWGVRLSTPVHGPGFTAFVASVGTAGAAVFRMFEGTVFVHSDPTVRSIALQDASTILIDSEVHGLCVFRLGGTVQALSNVPGRALVSGLTTIGG